MPFKYPRIRLAKARDFFGNYSKLADALEISRASVSDWCARDLTYVPEIHAWRLATTYPKEFGRTIPAERRTA